MPALDSDVDAAGTSAEVCIHAEGESNGKACHAEL